MRPAIFVKNLHKIYAKNADKHKAYGLADLTKELLGIKRNNILRKDEFYAVKDLSLTVYPGETVALIGENGCGKSTTLRMVAGLLKPDRGFVQVEGRMQALISLGAGFNSDLNGTDNIRLAAATIGMSKKETELAAGDIEKFADIGDFISSPVKHYSSGMYARLAFSVAIHMRPRILIVDEILGVGDYSFQNKCYSKMEEMRKMGVTILLVSHSHTKVVQLCKRAVWIEKGSIKREGESKDVVNAYLEYLDSKKSIIPQAKSLKAQSNPIVDDVSSRLYGPIYNESDFIENVRLSILKNGNNVTTIDLHDEIDIVYEFDIVGEIDNLNVTLNFATEEGEHITAISSLNGDYLSKVISGHVKVKISISDVSLSPGNYVITMPIHQGQAYLYRNVVERFSVKSNRNIVWGKMELKYEYKICQP